MKLLKFAPILLLIVALAVTAQTPTTSVEGTVVEMGANTPLSNATLELRSIEDTARRYPAVTAQNGQFVVRGAQPGKYSLTVSRSGYLHAQYEQRGPNGAAGTLTIAAGQRITGVRLSMMRGAAISGRVYGPDGAPAVNAQMHAWKISYNTGWRLAVPVVSQMTNDRGEFRLFGLPPGLYYVSAQPEPPMHIRSPAYASSAPLAPGAVVLGASAGMFSAISDPALARPGARPDWAPVYFGGTTNEYAATPIRVRPGNDLAGTDIVMNRTATSIVTGVITGPNGQALTGVVSVIATPSANPRFHATPVITVLGGVMTIAAQTPTRVNPTGRFTIGGMTPGSYTLTAFGAGPDGRRLSGQSVVVVQGTSTLEANITMNPGWDIDGLITVEGAASGTPGIADLKVQAISTIASQADVPPVSPSASGSFTLGNIGRGSYTLTVAPLSQRIGAPAATLPTAWKNAYVKSARLGDIDVLNDILRLDNPPAGRLELVVGMNGGTVTGTIRDNSRAVLPNVTVALVPDEPRRQRFDLYRSATTDAAGRYQFNAIPPGSYKVFAWEDVEPQSWYDQAFMRTFEDLGKAVTLTEGAAQTIDMTATSPLER